MPGLAKSGAEEPLTKGILPAGGLDNNVFIEVAAPTAVTSHLPCPRSPKGGGLWSLSRFIGADWTGVSKLGPLGGWEGQSPEHRLEKMF